MASKKGPEVTVEAAPAPEMKEDVTASAIPGPSSEDVYAELERTAASQRGNPSIPMTAVSVDDMQSAPPSDFGDREIESHGGRIDGDMLRFGDKVFYADPEKRKSLPSKENFATGPRRNVIPPRGDFLPGTKSFRGVPYRTINGHIRVDN